MEKACFDFWKAAQRRPSLFFGVHDPQLIIHRLHKILLHAEVFLGGLDRGVAQQHLDLLELSGHLFCFLNKRKNRIKVLVWDRTGYVVLYKLTYAWLTLPRDRGI